jgi:hypothetical protein
MVIVAPLMASKAAQASSGAEETSAEGKQNPGDNCEPESVSELGAN